MRFFRLGFVPVFFLLCVSATQQPVRAEGTATKRATTTPVAPAFEPLQQWKAAVVMGDRAQIASYYSTSPAAKAKTPQGETADPLEEPTFWSSVRSQTSGTINLKVLEVKSLQPGVMSFVLRMETNMKSDTGEKPAVISFNQVWGQDGGGWRILATQRSGLFPAGTLRLPQPAKPNTQLYPDAEEAPSEIAAAFRVAAKDHKRVILIFGGNWCYDCHVLDATFHTKAIAPLVTASYHVVHVNIGEYNQNLDIAKKYDVPLNKGVPAVTVLNPDGTLVFSQKGGEFENTGRIGPEDVVQFLEKWKPQS
jgi:thioredoxin 1